MNTFICVFECRIVNLATYRQFTKVAWDWIIQKKKKKKRKDRKEKKKKNYIKSGLSQFLFLLYLLFSWSYKVAAFRQCQCHSSYLRTWSIYWRRRQGAHGEIYKFHSSVISTHFFDQVQIFFFFAHCIVIKVKLETNC